MDTFLGKSGYEEMLWKKLLHLPEKQSEVFRPESVRLPQLNASRKRPLRHPVILMCRNEFTTDGSVPNKSIITATNGKMKYGWCGPILAVALGTDRTLEDPPYEDISLHDFRDIVDYFLAYNGTPTSTVRVQMLGKTQAVRIHCPAHMVTSGIEKFSVENINTIHPVYSMKPHVMCITSLIKLPLYLIRALPDAKWSSKKEDYVNHTAACLDYDFDKPTLNAHEKGWYEEGGDALVARADYQDLLPEHLEALADFCETKIIVQLIEAVNTPDYSDTVKSILAEQVTEEKFKLYWETYQRKMAISDPRWGSISSPYD
ncbi:hypothetical protein MMC17_004118 [Xylographa soralifera]|nr:hypothetical protein [Xylographa soralifera]